MRCQLPFFRYPLLALIVLLSSQLSAKNADISYWTKNVSEMKSEEITELHDYNAEVAVSGQTVHLLWMADSAYAKRFVFYRRSLDGGQTWQDRKKIYSTDFNDIITDRDQERLAVAGNSVHVVINGYARGESWAGQLIYLRSTDNGVTFEAPRILFWAAQAHHVLNTRVRTEGKRVLIPFRVQTNWLVNNSGRLLVSDDNGNSFQERQIYDNDTGSGWHLADLCHQGDNIHALYLDSEYYYGIQYGNLYLASSTDAGRTFNSKLISVPSANGKHKTYPLFDANYNPKMTMDGNNVWVVWAGQDQDDVLSVFLRHSPNNGQTFDPAINLSRADLPAGLVIKAGQETITAQKDLVCVMFTTEQKKVFFTRSVNGGASFDTPRQLAKNDDTRYLDSAWWPQVQIDPNDASGQTIHLLWSWFTHDFSVDGGTVFHGPQLLSPHFSWCGLGPSYPRLDIDQQRRLHIVQEGGWSYYSSTGYGDQDIFYRCYDMNSPPVTQQNQALKIDYFPHNGETGETRADNMQIPPHDDLAFTNRMTAEFWFKLDSDASMNPMRLLVKENAVSAHSMPKGYQIGLHFAADHLRPNGGVKTTTGEYMVWSEHILQPEQWTHLALTYDSTVTTDNLRLYVNGRLSAAVTATGRIVSSDGILFVGAVDKTDGTEGTFDELRLWNRVLSEQEIRSTMSTSLTGLETGLVAYYTFNGTTRDMTGKGHDGLLMYKETFVPSNINTEVAEPLHSVLPEKTTLLPNYPNPFNPETKISFFLSGKSTVEITIYNIHGQVVEVLLDRAMAAGHHTFSWQNRNGSSGIYICKMKAGDFNQTRRMVLMK